MKIKKIKFQNFISNSREIEIDFVSKLKEEDNTFFKDISFPRIRSKIGAVNGILKTIAVMGLNASYKTSTLKSVDRIIDFVVNFKDNVENFTFNSINFHKVMEWYEEKNGISPFENRINFKETVKQFLKATSKKSNEDLIRDYVIDYYNNNSFDKEKPIVFELVFDDNKKERIFSVMIFAKTNRKLNFVSSLNGNKVNLFKEKINFKHSMASLESYNVNGRQKRIDNNIGKEKLVESALIYLFQEVFNSKRDKLEHLLKILDKSIIGFKMKKIDERMVFKTITRKYDSTDEDINLNQLSSGAKVFIFYLYQIMKSEFIIIDEIEQSLHRKLVNILIDVAKENNKQLLFSTHDPVVIRENIKMYQLIIFNIKNYKLTQNLASSLFRDQKDNFVNKYLNDMVSNIKSNERDWIRMELY